MGKAKGVVLICKRVVFYALKDENAFLNWVKSIKSIKGLEYEGDQIHLYFKTLQISDNDLQDLIALFFRYKIKMEQLAVFLNDKNREWFFANSKMYWHKKVFKK